MANSGRRFRVAGGGRHKRVRAIAAELGRSHRQSAVSWVATAAATVSTGRSRPTTRRRCVGTAHVHLGGRRPQLSRRFSESICGSVGVRSRSAASWAASCATTGRFTCAPESIYQAIYRPGSPLTRPPMGRVASSVDKHDDGELLVEHAARAARPPVVVLPASKMGEAPRRAPPVAGARFEPATSGYGPEIERVCAPTDRGAHAVAVGRARGTAIADIAAAMAASRSSVACW